MEAVSIRPFSAFTTEEELVLAPGTLLDVVDVSHDASGLTTVKLAERDATPLVS